MQLVLHDLKQVAESVLSCGYQSIAHDVLGHLEADGPLSHVECDSEIAFKWFDLFQNRS